MSILLRKVHSHVFNLKKRPMPQSLVKLYVHIIFSTKNRRPLIDEEIENPVYSYLGGICNRLECFPLKIGGHKEHVHILSHLSKKITDQIPWRAEKSLFELDQNSTCPIWRLLLARRVWCVFRESAIHWDCKTIHWISTWAPQNNNVPGWISENFTRKQYRVRRALRMGLAATFASACKPHLSPFQGSVAWTTC
jgi:REP element-mobilizing transposase RayT